MSTYLKSLQKYGFKGTLQRLYTLKRLKDGTYMGSDSLGNKYFENLEYEYGQHRWFEPPIYENPQLQEASVIDPAWHGWLHCTTDAVPNTPSHPAGSWTGEAVVKHTDASNETHWVGKEVRENAAWRPNPTLKRERGYNVDGYYSKAGENAFYTQTGHPLNPFHAPHQGKTGSWDPTSASIKDKLSTDKGAPSTKFEKFMEERNKKTLAEAKPKA